MGTCVSVTSVSEGAIQFMQKNNEALTLLKTAGDKAEEECARMSQATKDEVVKKDALIKQTLSSNIEINSQTGVLLSKHDTMWPQDMEVLKQQGETVLNLAPPLAKANVLKYVQEALDTASKDIISLRASALAAHDEAAKKLEVLKKSLETKVPELEKMSVSTDEKVKVLTDKTAARIQTAKETLEALQKQLQADLKQNEEVLNATLKDRTDYLQKTTVEIEQIVREAVESTATARNRSVHLTQQRVVAVDVAKKSILNAVKKARDDEDDRAIGNVAKVSAIEFAFNTLNTGVKTAAKMAVPVPF